jgi:hypothetical protein
MRRLRKIYYYLKFFFEADTGKVRNKACTAAYEWCRHNHQELWTESEYDDARRYLSAHTFIHCHNEAMYQLKKRGM